MRVVVDKVISSGILYHLIEGTSASVDFGIHREFWNNPLQITRDNCNGISAKTGAPRKIYIYFLQKKYLYIFIPLFIVFLLRKSTKKQINESMEFQVVLCTVYKTK